MTPITLIEKAFLLKKTPIFRSLDLDLLLPIADRLILQKVGAQETIFDIHEQAYSLYLIAEGDVDIFNETGEKLASLKKEEIFGDESLFNQSPRAYRAKTTSPTLLLTLSANDLFAILQEHPKSALGLLEAYATAMPFRHRH